MTSTSLALPSFDLNWASGFADGESCIHIAKQTYKDLRRKATYRLRMCIEQNDLQVLEHFLRGMKALGLGGTTKPSATGERPWRVAPTTLRSGTNAEGSSRVGVAGIASSPFMR